MNQYTIHCTPEQTKKALELGAPIETFGHEDVSRQMIEEANKEGLLNELERILNETDHATAIGELAYVLPTAEQMIGWLEEQGLYFHFDHLNLYSCMVSNSDSKYIMYPKSGSRKEATTAAIDAALEYLSNNK